MSLLGGLAGLAGTGQLGSGYGGQQSGRIQQIANSMNNPFVHHLRMAQMDREKKKEPKTLREELQEETDEFIGNLLDK